MAHKVEIYTITKEGTLLCKYSILGMEETERDQLMSGFLMALNAFAKDIGFPSGVSLIRSGNLEARFSSGEYVFSVLIIDYSMPLGLMTEPILSGLSKELCDAFEEKYTEVLKKGSILNVYRPSDFLDFQSDISQIIDRYGRETDELYQKLVLIESMYAKVPQKWILPLIEKVHDGIDLVEELRKIPSSYRKQLKHAIDKVYFDSMPLWEIFAISTLPEDIFN